MSYVSIENDPLYYRLSANDLTRRKPPLAGRFHPSMIRHISISRAIRGIIDLNRNRG